MSPTTIPDPSMDGTVWGTSSLLRRNPHVQFFCCDPRRPQTPSHVWWDGITFAVDPAVFERQPRTDLRSDHFVRISFGPLELIADGSGSLTLADLEAAQQRAQAAGGSNP